MIHIKVIAIFFMHFGDHMNSLSIIIPKTLFFLNNHEVCGLILVTYLNQNTIFEWWVVRSICKNGHQEYMFTKLMLKINHSFRSQLSRYLWSLLRAHCPIKFNIYNNSRLVTKLYGIHPCFFRYICRWP